MQVFGCLFNRKTPINIAYTIKATYCFMYEIIHQIEEILVILKK